MHDPRESFRPSPPVILDFDGSVLPVAEGERRIPLGSWQEAIRFGCTRRAFSALEAHLEGVLPVDCGCAFMGSGDFHHVTLIPLRRLCRRLPPASLDVVVFDNHPDNMRYPFGIHCGSWVSHAALLPSVRRVHVIGITSGDIGLAHAWENRLTPFLRRKLTYWSVGTDAAWLRLIGRAECCRSFGSADELVRGLLGTGGCREHLSFHRQGRIRGRRGEDQLGSGRLPAQPYRGRACRLRGQGDRRGCLRRRVGLRIREPLQAVPEPPRRAGALRSASSARLAGRAEGCKRRLAGEPWKGVARARSFYPRFPNPPPLLLETDKKGEAETRVSCRPLGRMHRLKKPLSSIPEQPFSTREKFSAVASGKPLC